MIQTFPSLQFRFAQPADALALAEVMINAQERKWSTKYSPSDRDYLVKFYAHDLEDDMQQYRDWPVLMSLYQNQPVGFNHYRLSSASALFTERLYAYSPEITKGIGSALLKETLAIENVDSITLFPVGGSKSAYLRWGFDTTVDGDVELTGNHLQAWRDCTHGNYPRFDI